MATTTNADGSVTVTLKYKLAGEKGEISELTLKRAKGKQIRNVDLAALARGDQMIPLIQDLAGISDEVADQIDSEDFVDLSAAVNGFFNTTGAGAVAKTTNTDGSVTVPLKHPIKGAEGEMPAITLKRLKGKALRTIDITSFTKGHEIMGAIQSAAVIEPFVADQIDAEDFVELSLVVKGFFGKRQTTGAP